jgi:hypothetical protein
MRTRKVKDTPQLSKEHSNLTLGFLPRKTNKPREIPKQGGITAQASRRVRARSARRKGMRLTTQQQPGMTRCRPTGNFHLPTLLQDASHRRDRLKGGNFLFVASIVVERMYRHFREMKRSIQGSVSVNPSIGDWPLSHLHVEHREKGFEDEEAICVDSRLYFVCKGFDRSIPARIVTSHFWNIPALCGYSQGTGQESFLCQASMLHMHITYQLVHI